MTSEMTVVPVRHQKVTRQQIYGMPTGSVIV